VYLSLPPQTSKTNVQQQKVLDKAILEGSDKIEMEPLDAEQLKNLFHIYFPSATKQVDIMEKLAALSDDIRMECKKEDANISTIIPPRSMVHMAKLVMDNFSLLEISRKWLFIQISPTMVEQIVRGHL